MNQLSLTVQNSHLYVELEGALWLLDTGAPSSVGRVPQLAIEGVSFGLVPDFFGLNADTLSDFVGVPCAGLLGADILNQFDLLFDLAGGTLTVSTSELPAPSPSVNLAVELFMGIPIVTADIAGSTFRLFFDTGAQISYFQGESLTEFPNAGDADDFFPGFGAFQTPTYRMPVSLGGESFLLRCGRLPEMLAATLMMANTQGILGNTVLMNRTVGYFPRRERLCLGRLSDSL